MIVGLERLCRALLLLAVNQKLNDFVHKLMVIQAFESGWWFVGADHSRTLQYVHWMLFLHKDLIFYGIYVILISIFSTMHTRNCSKKTAVDL